jgi:ribonuclease E
MLIDATHAEETRVVVADGNQLLEFDYETSTKKQLKGNIYLAKVTRVEPSLQAAFVEFGGNRHGFLAFNEIHPDYYRIPVEDREALLARPAEDPEGDDGEDTEAKVEGEPGEPKAEGDSAEPKGDGEPVEVLDGDDADEIEEIGDAQRQRLRAMSRQYKVQEVIKRRQVLLVQVVKEERGNKGAALTTYLSLPGRYCVLMPNTARGGGISRKVSNPAERKAMKAILSDLDVPEGMAVIMRTAGVGRSRSEIRRDYEYLRRLWDDIRELTLKSSAPALIYEEGDVIKRSLRDTYNRDIDEVLIEGEEAYKAAKALMKTMIPSHAKRVQKYDDTEVPLFNRYRIEAQLDEIYEPAVTLKSGGYLVINPTEALVAIDVNSGRATRQRNVESTARQTNLEAAEEIARQLRLRDLAGLIVIDFIDMDESRNNAAVERKLKESMKADRARIQIGRISPFGLLELSRQRLRPSLTEASSQTCPMCGGSGHIRSIESSTLRILRAIEDEGTRRRTSELQVNAPTKVALYLLNHKRHALSAIEARFALRVAVNGDDELVPPDFNIERLKEAQGETGEIREPRDERPPAAEEEERGSRRRRRGRRRRDEDIEAPPTEAASAEDDEDESDAEAASDGSATTERARDGEDDEARRARRRRGRRGGRRRRRGDDALPESAERQPMAGDGEAASAEPDNEPASAADVEMADVEMADVEMADVEMADVEMAENSAIAEPDGAGGPAQRRPRNRRRRSAEFAGPAEAASDDGAAGNEDAAGAEGDGSGAAAPKRRRRPRRRSADREASASGVAAPIDAGSSAAAPRAAPAGEPEAQQVATPQADTAGDIAEASVQEPPSPEPAPPQPAAFGNGRGAAPRHQPNGSAAHAAAGENGLDPMPVPGDAAPPVESGKAAATTSSPDTAQGSEPPTSKPQRRGWWNRVIG